MLRTNEIDQTVDEQNKMTELSQDVNLYIIKYNNRYLIVRITKKST